MLEALKMTPFGALHTVISLIAVVAGFTALVRNKEISPQLSVGKIYVAATILPCLTGLGIFHHGGFGAPHVLAIITLFVVGVAVTAARTSLFGRVSRYVEMVSYSLTFFFHTIPAVNETATRFPLGAPLATSPEAPALQVAAGVLFIVFLVGAFLQVHWLRTRDQGSTFDARLSGHEELSR